MDSVYPSSGKSPLFRTLHVERDDPGAALVLACVREPNDATAWRLLRAELDPLLRCVTAFAQLRKITTFVFPQIKRMRLDRRTDLSAPDVFVMFNRPYWIQYRSSCSLAHTDFAATQDALWQAAERTTAGFKASVRSNVTGRKERFAAPVGRAERFSAPAPFERTTFFGVHVDGGRNETLVEEFNVFEGMGSITKVFKMLPRILKMVTELAKIALMIAKAFGRLFHVLTRDPLDFVVQLLLLLVNAAILVAVTVLTPVITATIWAVTACMPLALKLAFFSTVFAHACVWNLVLSLGDAMTGGQLRHLDSKSVHELPNCRRYKTVIGANRHM